MLQVLLSLIFSISAWSAVNGPYPINPDPELTPGAYCSRPDSHRYKERIPYCNRNVSSSEKWEVINVYNKKFDYKIGRRERTQFKIDHLIPLCMGGSNEFSNLWPQHESVYVVTDPLEGAACDKMAKGRLLQQRAVELLTEAKMNLEMAPEILREIQSL